MSQRIHLIAIGGAIMHQLAIALHKMGYQITGSDDAINDPALTNLKIEGLLPDALGWYPNRIHANLDMVILGMHAKSDNPELQEAKRLGLRVLSFPEFMYEVSKDKKRAVIAGSHGKTTITSMVMHVLKAANLSFDYLVGAKVQGFEQSVQISNAPIMVMEGDEYPASAIEKVPKIFFYQPHITVISGIAWDHINVFPTFDNYVDQFRQYLNKLAPQAQVFYNAEDDTLTTLISEMGIKAEPYKTPTYGYDENGRAYLEALGKQWPLEVFGRHNIQNMEAAHKIVSALGVSDDIFYKAISEFAGAARRLEPLMTKGALRVYRDFAHSPSKLKATVDSVKEAHPQTPVLAIFELHTYSSLNTAFLNEYKQALDKADVACVYFSAEALRLKTMPPLDPQAILEGFGRKDITVLHTPDRLIDFVKMQVDDAQPICVLLMSSGTFDGIQWIDVLNK